MSIKRKQVLAVFLLVLSLSILGAVTALADGCLPPPCTRTPGFWKNHEEAWPDVGITIGGVYYSKAEAIEIMNTHPTKGDKTYTIFGALVAAKLNVLEGNDDSCLENAIADADMWMGENGPVGSNVRGNDPAWQDCLYGDPCCRCTAGGECLYCGGECLYLILDDYNNGELCCASHCD